MAKTTRIFDIEKAIHGNKVKTDFVAVPHTQIKGEDGQPRKIADLENNLKAHFGTERFHIKGLSRVTNEFGPNGEEVFQPQNRDARVRFVGDWKNTSSSNGSLVGVATAADTNSFVEITFYGTGLNLLRHFDGNDGDYRASVDGGPESGNLYDPNLASVINVRNYEMNSVLSITSGLSLGIHTVKIRNNNAPTNPLLVFGFEVINESAQLVVNAGKPFVGNKASELDVQTLLDVSPAALTGDKGGRVITYIDESGNLNQAVNSIDINDGDKTEYVTNGTFDVDVSDWTKVEGSGSGTMQHTATGGGRLEVIMPAATRVGAKTTLSGLTVGQGYEISFDSYLISGSGSIWYGVAQSITDVANNGVNTGIAAEGSMGSPRLGAKLYFTANAATMEFAVSTNSSNTTAQWDNISVKESSANMLPLVDHSNEEILKTIRYSEFSRNRADDFSVLDGSSRDLTYTLDDGTTNLTGDNVSDLSVGGNVGIRLNVGDSIKITFVGTGLDFTHLWENTLNKDEFVVTIDGVRINTTPNDTAHTDIRLQKVCSGLPYGTHTVRIDGFGSGGAAGGPVDFIVYGPKKPTLPENVIELADYNVVADFAAFQATDKESFSTGVVRKNSLREMTYGGAWTFAGLDINFVSGFNFYTTNNGVGYFEYTFFGTGVDMRMAIDNAANAIISVNGSSDLSGLDVTQYGAATFTPATGEIIGPMTSGSRVIIKDLPLGVHTVRVTKGVGVADALRIDAFDIITPIHVNSKDFKTGSLSLLDLREDNTIENESRNIDLSKAKAWLVYFGNTNEIIESYNISAVLKSSTGNYRVYFKQPFKNKYYAMAGSTLTGTSKLVGAFDQYSDRIHIARTNDAGGVEDGGIALVFFGELENEEDINLEEL